jgi:DNA invertase Pin-like site-specific DNA recombinase
MHRAASSGEAIANRPGFLALMDAAQARVFTELLVMEISRLSRKHG